MTDSQATPVFSELMGSCLVEIYDLGDSRSLYFGGRFLQSRMSLSSPHRLLLPYTHHMMFALLLVRRLRRVLLIGLGAGSLVRFLHHHFPECMIDAVDHSAAVIKLAKGYFRLPETSRLHIHCRDGQEYLAELSATTKYDLILLDAFDEEGMSAHIYAEPVFRRCSAILSPGGILCGNLWSGVSDRIESITDDFAVHFAGSLRLPVPKRGNVILLASAETVDWQRILRPRRELRLLQQRFGLDFPGMLRVALRNNMSFGRRLYHLFSW